MAWLRLMDAARTSCTFARLASVAPDASSSVKVAPSSTRPGVPAPAVPNVAFDIVVRAVNVAPCASKPPVNVRSDRSTVPWKSASLTLVCPATAPFGAARSVGGGPDMTKKPCTSARSKRTSPPKSVPSKDTDDPKRAPSKSTDWSKRSASKVVASSKVASEKSAAPVTRLAALRSPRTSTGAWNEAPRASMPPSTRTTSKSMARVNVTSATRRPPARRQRWQRIGWSTTPRGDRSRRSLTTMSWPSMPVVARHAVTAAAVTVALRSVQLDAGGASWAPAVAAGTTTATRRTGTTPGHRRDRLRAPPRAIEPPAVRARVYGQRR